MNKKIIAVALIIVLIVSVFTACKNKYVVEKINGVEYPLVTDDEGNTIIDDDYRVAFYVTDVDGNILKNDNGETQTNWAQLYNQVFDENLLQDTYYKMTVGKGWSADSAGTIVKDGTDSKCYMKCVKISEITEDINIITYLTSIEEQDNQLVEGLNAEGYKAEIIKDTTTITIKNLACTTYIFKILDKDGNLIHYAENFYYIYNDVIYKLEYACLDGVGYDEEFIFEAYLNANFMVKD